MADNKTKELTGGTATVAAPIEGVTLGRANPSDDDVGFKKRTYFTPEYYEVSVPYSVKDKGNRYESAHRAILWQDDEGVIYAIGQAAPNVGRQNELEEYQYIAEQQEDGEFKYTSLKRAEFKNPNSLSLVIIWSSQNGVDGTRPRLDDETWRVQDNRGALLFDPTQLDQDGTVVYPDGTPVYDAQDKYMVALGRARSYLGNWSNDIVRTKAIGNLINKPRVVKFRKGFPTIKRPKLNVTTQQRATKPEPASSQPPADPPAEEGSALEQEENQDNK